MYLKVSRIFSKKIIILSTENWYPIRYDSIIGVLGFHILIHVYMIGIGLEISIFVVLLLLFFFIKNWN